MSYIWFKSDEACIVDEPTVPSITWNHIVQSLYSVFLVNLIYSLRFYIWQLKSLYCVELLFKIGLPDILDVWWEFVQQNVTLCESDTPSSFKWCTFTFFRTSVDFEEVVYNYYKLNYFSSLLVSRWKTRNLCIDGIKEHPLRTSPCKGWRGLPQWGSKLIRTSPKLL